MFKRSAAYIGVVQEILIIIVLCCGVKLLVVLGIALGDSVCRIRVAKTFPLGLPFVHCKGKNESVSFPREHGSRIDKLTRYLL